MATIENWQKYINLLHELALVEDDLRMVIAQTDYLYGDNSYGEGQVDLAERIMYERFDVQY